MLAVVTFSWIWQPHAAPPRARLSACRRFLAHPSHLPAVPRKIPTFSGAVLDLPKLYSEITARGGLAKARTDAPLPAAPPLTAPLRRLQKHQPVHAALRPTVCVGAEALLFLRQVSALRLMTSVADAVHPSRSVTYSSVSTVLKKTYEDLLLSYEAKCVVTRFQMQPPVPADALREGVAPVVAGTAHREGRCERKDGPQQAESEAIFLSLPRAPQVFKDRFKHLAR